MMQISR